MWSTCLHLQICTIRLAKSVLQAGTNVFLEKPMCPSVREADDLLEIAEARKLLVGVNYNFLFSGAYQTLREASFRDARVNSIMSLFNYLYELDCDSAWSVRFLDVTIARECTI